MTTASWTAHGPTSALPVSTAVSAGDVVATAGQVPYVNGEVVTGGFEAQVRATLDNLKASLEAAGCSLRDVFKVNTYLTDLANADVYNAVYEEYFEPPFPARTTVGAALLGFDIEVEAWARST